MREERGKMKVGDVDAVGKGFSQAAAASRLLLISQNMEVECKIG
jgi:hypothetical protein